MQDTLNPWLQVLSELQKKIDQNSFETWFEPTVFIGQEGDSLYIKVPNSYFKDWLSFHYSALINEAGQKLSAGSSTSSTSSTTPAFPSNATRPRSAGPNPDLSSIPT